MDTNELKVLILTHKKSLIKTEFECKKAQEIINALSSIRDIELEHIALNVIKKGFFGLNELCESVDIELHALSKKRADEFYIKDFKGTHYEQEALKKSFCYQKLLRLMPESFKALKVLKQ